MLVFCIFAALTSLTQVEAIGQSWPTKGVRLLVPYPPGGASDIQSRLVAGKLSERWGVPVVVENKPGGNTVIATDAVAKAAPDGHTLLLTAMPFALNPMLIAKLPYSSEKDLVPVTLLATIPNILVVNPGIQVRSVRDLIGWARTNPGSLSFASAGQATSTHLSAELFVKMSGLEATHVPYKGSAQAHLDLISGRVPIMFDNGALQHVKAGRLTAVAVTSATRVPWLPEIPTVAEQGLPGYEAVAWYGVMAPGGTSAELVQRLANDITWAVRSPDVVEKLRAIGANAEGGAPEEFRNLIANETIKWGRLIRELGIKAE
jgi:tripartite-type tricarboxylate transporter receptor subunit TctC